MRNWRATEVPTSRRWCATCNYIDPPFIFLPSFPIWPIARDFPASASLSALSSLLPDWLFKTFVSSASMEEAWNLSLLLHLLPLSFLFWDAGNMALGGLISNRHFGSFIGSGIYLAPLFQSFWVFGFFNQMMFVSSVDEPSKFASFCVVISLMCALLWF